MLFVSASNLLFLLKGYYYYYVCVAAKTRSLASSCIGQPFRKLFRKADQSLVNNVFQALNGEFLKWPISKMVIQGCLVSTTDVHMVEGVFHALTIIFCLSAECLASMTYSNTADSLRRLYSPYLYSILYQYCVQLFYNFSLF